MQRVRARARVLRAPRVESGVCEDNSAGVTAIQGVARQQLVCPKQPRSAVTQPVCAPPPPRQPRRWTAFHPLQPAHAPSHRQSATFGPLCLRGELTPWLEAKGIQGETKLWTRNARSVAHTHARLGALLGRGPTR